MPESPKRQVPDGAYGVIGLLIAIAGLAIAALALSLTQFFLVLMFVSFVGLAWRWWYRGSPWDLLVGLAGGVFVAALAAAIISGNSSASVVTSAPDPKHEASPGRVIHVYNKVTSGPKAMRDDAEDPVYLSSKPVAFCDERDCRIAGTNRETGGVYDEAVCRLKGERVTNGQDTSPGDNSNPGLFTTHWYFGVRLDPETFGYVSEVWVAPEDRGGLGLPVCF